LDSTKRFKLGTELVKIGEEIGMSKAESTIFQDHLKEIRGFTEETSPLKEKIEKIQSRITQSLGSNSKPFDMKKFTNELWNV